jgi:hypothetical protein
MDETHIDVHINEENLRIISKHTDFLSVINYPIKDSFLIYEVGKMKIYENTYLHFHIKPKEKERITLENLMEDVEILLQDNLTKLQEIRKSLK